MKSFELLTVFAIVHGVFALAGSEVFTSRNKKVNARSVVARSESGDGQSQIASTIDATTPTNSTSTGSMSSVGGLTTAKPSTSGTFASPQSTATMASSTSAGVPAGSESTTRSTQASTTTQSPASTSGTLVAVSTITTVPESFSTQLITESGLSTNSWLTTSNGTESSSTVVPVIWCPECGGPVVVWGLPSVTAVAWDLPNLPSFEIPCIPSLNDCTSPPVAEEEGKPESKSEPENGKSTTPKPNQSTESRIEPTTSMSTTSTHSTSTSSTTSSSSSSESCSAGMTTHGQYNDVLHDSSIQPTATTSITISEGEACTINPGQQYNAIQTFKDAGLPLLGWMQYPITDDLLPDLGGYVQDPGDDESFENRGDLDDGNEEDDYVDSGDETSTSTQTGRIEQTASSLDIPTGTYSNGGRVEKTASSLDIPTETYSNGLNGGRVHGVEKTALSLDIPTEIYTLRSPPEVGPPITVLPKSTPSPPKTSKKSASTTSCTYGAFDTSFVQFC